MKRIFLALKIEFEEKMKNIVSSLKTVLINEKISWTRLDNVHITLIFIGDTDEIKIVEIKSILENICHGTGSFELTLRGLGLFKSERDPRIIWTGIERSDRLYQLNKTLVVRLREAGLNLEDKQYNPHITLGRIKHIEDNSGLNLLINTYKNEEIQKVPVNEVILYESILKPEGPIYKPIGIYKL